MQRRRSTLATIVFAMPILAAGEAAAAAQRTFVASYGVSTNTAFNCSVTKPCRAFSEALGVTNDSGEVLVLDSAGYGPVTITKPVSIIAPPGIYAGISVFGGDGVVISAGSTDAVTLRGLTINRQGVAPVDYGVHLVSGNRLVVEDCEVSGMYAGIYVESSGVTAYVSIKNTVLRGNQTSGFAATGPIEATLDAVHSVSNFHGVDAYSGSRVTVSGSVLSGNAYGAYAQSSAGTLAAMFVSHSTITGGSYAFAVDAMAGGNASIVADANTVAFIAATIFKFVGTGGMEVIYSSANNAVGYYGTATSGGSVTPLGPL